jgi:hypothetical protein
MKSQRETTIRTNLINKLKDDFITEAEAGRSRYPDMDDEEMLEHLRFLFYLFLEKYCFVKRVAIREGVIVPSRKIEEKVYEAEKNRVFPAENPPNEIHQGIQETSKELESRRKEVR